MNNVSQKSAERIAKMEQDWKENPRWKGIERRYTAADVERLRGSLGIEYTIAKHGAEKLWKELNEAPFIAALGASTGNQAMQQVKAGIKAIYVSGWQVAADANTSGEMYPDQNLYPCDSVTTLAKSINKSLQRADQMQPAEQFQDPEKSKDGIDWFVPLVADAEAGFGGVLNAYELMKRMIEAGVSGVHFEDQDPSSRKFGPEGGKAIVPTREAIDKLVAARLAADVCGVPTVLIARTDAFKGNLLTSDIDPNDKPFCTGERTREGHYRTRPGLEQSISRASAYAPYADVIWCQTDNTDLDYARAFAEAIHARFPGKLLAHNLATTYRWSKNMSKEDISQFQNKLAAMGYKFQFITVGGFHALSYSMFDLARNYRIHGMNAYADLQDNEYSVVEHGFTAVDYQKEVGTAYFSSIGEIVQKGAK